MVAMRNIDALKVFYDEINKDKTLIFNYQKVSGFERNLYLSISNFMKNNYGYQLKGLTKVHFKRLFEEVNIRDGDIGFVEYAFELHSMIGKRSITMGYGSYAKKIIKNHKLEAFIKHLRDYIEELERKTST
jgi:ABC-type sulfate transport system substrate-binding protein